MIKNYLLPNKFKKIGLWIALPFIVGCLYCLLRNGTSVWPCHVFTIYTSDLGFGDTLKPAWFTMIKNEGIFDEFCMLGLAISFIFIAFSKEKDEDECISQIRMQSLVWSLLVSTCILAFVVIFFYGFEYMKFSFAYPFIIFLLFISKFHIELWKFKKSNGTHSQNEEGE